MHTLSGMKMFASLCSLLAIAPVAVLSSPTAAFAELTPMEVIDVGNIGSGSSQIVNGTAALDTPEHRAVVALHLLANGGTAVAQQPFCSGTLITDTVVLTAAHCVEVNPLNNLPFTPNDLAIYIGDNPSVDLVENLHLISESNFHPGYDPRTLENDIAVVVLREPVFGVTPIPPMPSVVGFSPGDLGLGLNFVGFGQTEAGTSGVKLQTDGTLDGLGCTVNGCPFIGNTNQLMSYTMLDSGPCFGDSGGPAFFTRGNRSYVAGVTSFGDENCRQYGASTRVDGYGDYIAQFIGVDQSPPTVSIVSPVDNTRLAPGFDITVNAQDDESVVRMDLFIDSVPRFTLFSEPWVFSLPAGLVADGQHQLQVVAYDSNNTATAVSNVTIEAGAPPLPPVSGDPTGGGDSGGGCAAAGGSHGAGLWLIVVGFLVAISRRRRTTTVA